MSVISWKTQQDNRTSGFTSILHVTVRTHEFKNPSIYGLVAWDQRLLHFKVSRFGESLNAKQLRQLFSLKNIEGVVSLLLFWGWDKSIALSEVDWREVRGWWFLILVVPKRKRILPMACMQKKKTKSEWYFKIGYSLVNLWTVL